MLWFLPKRLKKWCHHLDGSTDTTCTDADTYYKIGWTWTDWDECNDWFEYDGSWKITYTWSGRRFFLFNGTSDLKVSAASTITYALYVNGVLVSNAQTPTTFVNTSKIGNISITNIIPLNTWDYIEVYVKSSVAWVTVTHETLFLTFLSDR